MTLPKFEQNSIELKVGFSESLKTGKPVYTDMLAT